METALIVESWGTPSTKWKTPSNSPLESLLYAQDSQQTNVYKIDPENIFFVTRYFPGVYTTSMFRINFTRKKGASPSSPKGFPVNLEDFFVERSTKFLW